MGAVAFQRGLIAHWPMDERSGGTAYDQSPEGNNGTINGAVYTRGVLGWALDFDGVEDYVEVPDDSSLDAPTVKFSLSLWFKTSTPKYTFCANKNGKAVGYGIWLYDSPLSVRGRIDDGTNWVAPDYGTDPFDGKWHHVVLTGDGSNARLYYDGSHVASADISGIGDISNAKIFEIGSAAQGTNNYFDGEIDGVRFYDRALSESEIKDLYYYGAEPSTKIPPVSRAKV